MTNTRPPRPEPAQPRPRPSDERARLAADGRTTKRIASLALVLALVATGLAVARWLLPSGSAASCQQAAWDVKPSAADLPEGYALSATQYDINRQQTTLLGPLPADETAAQGVVYATVTCFANGAQDAVNRSEQAARDAKQTVTERPDLGDGGFSAVDETGATFLQLRHGDVVVYLAASADVIGSEVDALASAYDKAMGGDGGAPTVANTPDPNATEAPAASDDVPSDEAPSDAAAAPELEALLPTQVNDITLTVDSAIGSDILGDDSASRAITAALRADGKTTADLSFAQAYDESQAADLSLLAIAVDGLSEDKTLKIVKDSWLSASGAGITESELTWSGRTVTRIDYGDDGTKDYVIAENGNVIVVTTADEALAEAAVAALPKPAGG